MKPFNIFALLTLNFDRLDVYTFVMLRWFRVNMNFKPVVNSSGVVWISSPHGHVKECGFRNPVNFCMSNPGSWKFLLVESGILGLWIRNTAVGIRNPFLSCFIRTGIRNPSSAGKDLEPSNCKPESMGWKQNPRVSWISLHGENLALVSSVSQASVPRLCTDPPFSPKVKCLGSKRVKIMFIMTVRREMISAVDLCLCFDDFICFRQSAHFFSLLLFAMSSLPLSSSLLKLPTVRDSSFFMSVRGSMWDMRGHAKKYGLKGGLPKIIGCKRGSPRKFHSRFALTASFNANTIKPL